MTKQLALVLALWLLLPSALAAQERANGSIVVIVTDAATRQPLDNAEIFLLGGDTPQTSLTNAQGMLQFPEIAPGVYRIAVERGDYKRSAVPEFEVAEGAAVKIAVALESSLRVIASVKARGSVSITTTNIGEGSPERRVSASLKSALDKLAGVSVDDTTFGPNSAFNVSLHNHDP
ncbi:MAG: carboxypeptidase-like regulatory domain-containing protein, partial [Candidatus Baltobacteraceae bacterium]